MLRRQHRNHASVPRKLKDRPMWYLVQVSLCVAVVSAISLGFIDHIRKAPGLRVKTIRVEGIEKLTKEEVLACAGITSDDCIFLLSPWLIRHRLQKMASVYACEVERRFPDKLTIRIQERTPLATLVVANRMYVLDKEGNVLRELGPFETHVGVLITQPAGITTVEVGERITAPAVQGAINVYRAYARTQASKYLKLSEISAQQASRICMYCDDLKCEIRWGREDFEKQAWKLDVLWKARNGHLDSKEYVDLRFGDDIACK